VDDVECHEVQIICLPGTVDILDIESLLATLSASSGFIEKNNFNKNNNLERCSEIWHVVCLGSVRPVNRAAQ
jgi:hypothetical protein